jgi:hypothetical protein
VQTVRIAPDTPPFFAACREFVSEHDAAAAWNDLQHYSRKHEGKLDLGCYRHSSGGSKAVYLTVVSLREDSVRVAERRMRGREHLLDEASLRAFAARRVRFVSDLNAQAAAPGSYAIRRGARGARIHADGTMDEQIGEG